MARVQHATWQLAYAEVLPPEALAIPALELEVAWLQAISSPPTPRHRVLVALEGAELVGFAATEPDELTALLVEPRWGRRGHGSRLLAAVVDHWRADGVSLGVTWVFEQDTVVSAFLESAGWGPESVGRSVETDGRTLRQRRWHTAL